MCGMCSAVLNQVEKCALEGPTVNVGPADTTEVEDAPSGRGTPERISLNERYEGTIEDRYDQDTIGVELKAGQTYVFTVVGRNGRSEGLTDSTLRLTDGTGRELSFNDNANADIGVYESQITYTAQTSGTHYLTVDGHDDLEESVFNTGDYALEVATNFYNVDNVLTEMTELGWGAGTPIRFNTTAITYNISDLTEDGQRLARWAFDMWSKISNLSFIEVGNSNAAIMFDDEKSGAYANLPSIFDDGTYYRCNININKGWVTEGDSLFQGNTLGSDGFVTYLHEIGHALGLSHTGSYNGNSGSPSFINDSYQMSVMSYSGQNQASGVDASLAYPVTPMVADVAAMWFLYGRPNDVYSGDTVWGANSNVGGALQQFFDAAFGNGPKAGIYDENNPSTVFIVDLGGNDVIDLSTVNVDQVINLAGGTSSDVAGLRGNMLIQKASVIEGYIGGTATDLVHGNSANNSINGGLGIDYVYGNAGADVMRGGNDNVADFVSGEHAQAAYDSSGATIYRLYQATFDRAPDYGGLSHWVRELRSQNLSEQQIASAFIRSEEFQITYGEANDAEYITLLYQNVLDRNSDSAGFQNWMNNLENGMSRANVLLGFSNSQEFINGTATDARAYGRAGVESSWSDDVFRLYQATLGRSPDWDGLLNWIGNFANGMSYGAVASGFVNSEEFQKVYGSTTNDQFVTLLYKNVLDRDPEDSGLQNWLNHLSSGMARERVVEGFAQSQEFINSSEVTMRDWMKQRPMDDQLYATGGDDMLFGGVGRDTFVFNADVRGNATVADLEAWDVIRLIGSEYRSSAEAMAALERDGANTVLEVGRTTVTFNDTRIADFEEDMFIFV